MLFPISVLSQSKNISGDSLGKYSYQIMTFQKKTLYTHLGTGFFIRKKDRIFFITAKHTLVTCDSLTGKQKTEYDFISLSFVKQNEYFDVATVNYAKPNDTCSCIPRDSDMDIAISEIDNKYSHYINSVEQFIIPPVNNIGDVEIYGQGFEMDSAALYMTDPHHLKIPKDSVTGIYADSISYYLPVSTEVANRKLKGFSGSPVFFQDGLLKNWRVAGVFTGVLFLIKDKIINSYLVISKIDNVLSILDSYL